MPTATGHTTAIRASRVIGKAVFNKAGETIGEVEDIVLDKSSDRLMFAVITAGGPLTAMQNYLALPWPVLDYDEKLGGFVIPYSPDELAKGPSANQLSHLTRDDGADIREAAYRHYGVDKGR
ncbi:MAG: PRC-barrel domain-containing protein [Hyphomicrobiaceae bacterium]